MDWYRSPSLLVALDGFDRNPQKFGHLFLSLTHFPSRAQEFLIVHFPPMSEVGKNSFRKYHNVV